MDITFLLILLAGILGASLFTFLVSKQRFTQAMHQSALEQNTLQQQLSAAQTDSQRLNAEQQSLQEKITQLQLLADNKSDELHAKQTELTAAQTQLQTLKTHDAELQSRHEQLSAEYKAERQTLLSEQAQLKDLLTEEAKGAKALASVEIELREQLEQFKQQRHELQTQNTQLQQRLQTLAEQHTQLKTTLEQKEQHFAEQFSQLEHNKTALSKEFENLANKIFEEKGQRFSASSQEALHQMLRPFSEQIKSFQDRVNQVNDEHIKGQTKLESEIRKVMEIGLKMSDEATNLASALKGDSQKRGAWGEAQLRKTLEMSGLIENTHFETQSAFKNADGKLRQTDFLIKLPDNQNLIIDSKVSLITYDEVVSATTEEAFQVAMNRHLKAVRGHIDDLASKDYTNVIGMKSPSFVLMFMPIEPAYIEALKHDKGLFEYGYKKGIVLVSHTTLIPILRTVSNLWMIQQSNAQAQEISERAGEIFNNVCLVAERLQKLGNTLGTVSNQYNDTVKAMAGQQGLYGKVERFEKISTKISKSLPKLDTKHSDFETERLALIVEELVDEPINEHPDEAPKNLTLQT